MHKVISVVLAVAVVSAVGVANFAGADDSRIRSGGGVIGVQGAVGTKADVFVSTRDRGVKYPTKSNYQVNWAVRFLIPGLYSFTVTAPGFKQVDRDGITLQTADIKLVDTKLELGTASTQITVSGEAALIDTTSATSGTVITPQEMNEMPSMSRVSTLLATLAPGVVAQAQNNNIAHLWSHDAASQFTVDGGRNNTRSNTFELDGMPNLKTGGQVAFMPPPDAIQEFRVQMNAYDSSIGRQAGGTVQMSIKSAGSPSQRTPHESTPK